MTTPHSFDLQPTLRGPTLKLRPLVEGDFEAVYRAASDPLIWAQHPAPDRYQRPVFEKWFADAMASKGALVVENAAGEVIGSSRYYDWAPAAQEIAVGFTFLTRAHWGGATNGELKTLMLDHAFRWARRVWFHVGPGNIRSQKALARIGAQLSHRGLLQTPSGALDYLFFKIDADAWRRRIDGVSRPALDIRTDDLRGAEIIALLQEHLDEMYRVSPPESVHALDLDGLRRPDITFWSAWLGGELAGCGALKELSTEHAEIKSMRTAWTHQRKGVASTVLRHILGEAQRRGYRRLSLETGSMAHFDPARRLYASFGFEYCGPFGQYVDDPNSVFMTKTLR